MKKILLISLAVFATGALAQQNELSAWDQFMNGINNANAIANPPNQFQNFPQAGGTIHGSQAQPWEGRQLVSPQQHQQMQQNQIRQPLNCQPNGFGGFVCQ